MNITATNDNGYNFNFLQPKYLTKMQSPATNAVLENTGIVETQPICKTHSTNMVEKTTETKKIYNLRNVKSIYTEPTENFGKNYFISYYGVNYSK